MDITYLNEGDPGFPAELRKYLADEAPARIAALGNLDILKEKKTAFFCSSKCPGELIIKAYDLSRKWRDQGTTVIGGFHSPMEQECRAILLRGKQPVIVCPARSLEHMRLKSEHKKALSENRLLFLSSFPAKEKRMTVETALTRNRFAAATADEVFIAHAAEGGKIEALCRELAARGRALTTFAGDSNSNLLVLGAKPVTY